MTAVLVTGVAGFIGSQVARRFLADGHEVVGVDDFSAGERANIPQGVHFIEGDLTQRTTLAQIPPGCTKILHLAGQSSGEISFDDPVADLAKNTVSTLNLIKYGIDRGCERIVYASSMSVYGPTPDAPIAESHPLAPLSCYGVGKRAAEGYLNVYASRLPFVSMRMFNVYGPGQNLKNLRQGMVSIYLAQALSSGKIHVKGALERFRDIIYIDDVVEAWVRAASSPQALNQTLNIATGVRTTVGGLLSRICALVPGSSYFVSGSTPGDQSGIYADTTRLREVLGMTRFVSLEQGLERFAASAREVIARDGAVA